MPEKYPCYPLLSPLATKDTLQHIFNTSFVCHFYLCLLRETAATGAPRLILPPHVNHQHLQQITSTSYSFGICSHVCWVGLVPDSPMKIDLLLELQLQSSNTKEGTLIALHLVFPLQLQVLDVLASQLFWEGSPTDWQLMVWGSRFPTQTSRNMLWAPTKFWNHWAGIT